MSDEDAKVCATTIFIVAVALMAATPLPALRECNGGAKKVKVGFQPMQFEKEIQEDAGERRARARRERCLRKRAMVGRDASGGEDLKISFEDVPFDSRGRS